MIPIAKPIIEDDEKRAVIDFADYCGTKYAVAVNSGTAALHTALYALGINKKDTVITTPFTFIATANSILMQNAKVAFTDIKPDTFNVDPDKIKITTDTKAIIPVNLFGQLADYDEIFAIAEDNDLKIVEDSAQAVGAEYTGRMAGSFGDIAIFSLYATKNLTAGEGGIITTDNEEYHTLAKRFRNHGQDGKIKYRILVMKLLMRIVGKEM